jgi:peptidyl-prolyl cis-trans isomerase SurA
MRLPRGNPRRDDHGAPARAGSGSKMVISDGEVDLYLANQARTGGGEEYQLAHILLRAPESASPEQLQKLAARRAGAQAGQGGRSFAELAASYSDAPDALQGGDIGWRPLDRLPQLYADVAAARMQPGEVSDLLRSSAGFTSSSCSANAAAAARFRCSRHARHILIRVNEVVSETEARRKMENRARAPGEWRRFRRTGAPLFAGRVGGQGRRSGLGQPGRYRAGIRAGDGCAEGQRTQSGGPVAVRHAPDPGPRAPPARCLGRTQAGSRASGLARAPARRAYQDWLRQLRDRAYVEIASTRNNAATHRRHQRRTGRHRAGTLPAPGAS